MRKRLRLLASCALWTIALLSGCSSGQQPMPYESTPVGVQLGRLRRAHSGAGRLASFAGARFRYTVKLANGETVSLHSVAIRFDDTRYVWTHVPTRSIGTRVDLQHWPAKNEWSLERLEEKLDFALRTVRVFFEPVSMSAYGRWTFRSLVAPRDVETPNWVEIEPLADSLVRGPYLLHADSETGLLDRIIYRAKHPRFAGQTHSVAFFDYQEFNGVQIARERVHTRRRTRDDEAHQLSANPFRLTEVSVRSVELLRDRIDDVLFLNHDEIDSWCPLPDDSLIKPSLAGTTDAGGLGQY